MKVTLNTQEIQEAVQCYIANVLGSELHVNDIVVVQGRDSNGSRIEVELSKYQPIDLDVISIPVQSSKSTKPLSTSTVTEKEEEEETPFDSSSDEEESATEVPEPAEVKDEPKAASVMTEGIKPLPGSFFSSN